LLFADPECFVCTSCQNEFANGEFIDHQVKRKRKKIFFCFSDQKIISFSGRSVL